MPQMNDRKTGRCQHICNHLDLESLGSWLTLCAQKLHFLGTGVRDTEYHRRCSGKGGTRSNYSARAGLVAGFLADNTLKCCCLPNLETGSESVSSTDRQHHSLWWAPTGCHVEANNSIECLLHLWYSLPPSSCVQRERERNRDLQHPCYFFSSLNTWKPDACRRAMRDLVSAKSTAL